jgi:hypothetical protein
VCCAGYAVIQAAPLSVSRRQRRAAVVASMPMTAPIRDQGARGSSWRASTNARSVSLSSVIPSARVAGPAPPGSVGAVSVDSTRAIMSARTARLKTVAPGTVRRGRRAVVVPIRRFPAPRPLDCRIPAMWRW